MKIVFFQGAFDILNAGHVRALKNAKAEGDYLIVGLNSDSLMRWYKRKPIVPFEQRKEILEGIKWLDRIIECHEPAAIVYLKRFDVSVYVLTEEWEEAQQEAIEWMEENGGKVVFSPRYPDILDSTAIRQRAKESS